MGMVTQEAYFRQRVLNHAAKHGVTAAAIRYHMSRKTVHKWKKRYDGTVESLQDLPRTPHHFPRQQTAAELKLVKRYAKKCKGDPLLGYENASKHGYNRSYGCFKKTARTLLQPEAKKRKKRKNKGTTAQFVGSAGDAFSAICFLQKSRFTSSKPSISAIASDKKCIRHRTNSFVRYCLNSIRCSSA